jgi:hypothetical protein
MHFISLSMVEFLRIAPRCFELHCGITVNDGYCIQWEPLNEGISLTKDVLVCLKGTKLSLK